MYSTVQGMQVLELPSHYLAGPSQGPGGTGHVINLLSNDLVKVKNCVVLVASLWISPVQLCILAYGAWEHMGPSTLGGLAFIIVTSCMSGVVLVLQVHGTGT